MLKLGAKFLFPEEAKSQNSNPTNEMTSKNLRKWVSLKLIRMVSSRKFKENGLNTTINSLG
jgi:hypothetical protein